MGRRHDLGAVHLEPREGAQNLFWRKEVLLSEPAASIAFEEALTEKLLPRDQIRVRIDIFVVVDAGFAYGRQHDLSRRIALVTAGTEVDLGDRTWIEDLPLVLAEHRRADTNGLHQVRVRRRELLGHHFV